MCARERNIVCENVSECLRECVKCEWESVRTYRKVHFQWPVRLVLWWSPPLFQPVPQPGCAPVRYSGEQHSQGGVVRFKN